MKKLFGIFLLFTAFLANSYAQSAVEIMEKSLDAMGKATSISYHFLSSERFPGGKYISADVQIRYQAKPLKVYADAVKPQTAKLSYIPSVSGKITVRKGLKLNLDPFSSLLMKEQHHPMYKAGFGTIKSILEHNMKMREGQDFGKYLKLIGTVTYDGRECWKLELNDPDHKIVNYTVKAGENTVWDLGKKLSIPEFKIKELNGIDDQIKVGQVLKVPTSYAKKTTLYIDKGNYLPIYQKMEDNVGVYETYEFKNVKLNVKFTDADFEV